MFGSQRSISKFDLYILKDNWCISCNDKIECEEYKKENDGTMCLGFNSHYFQNPDTKYDLQDVVYLL